MFIFALKKNIEILIVPEKASVCLLLFPFFVPWEYEVSCWLSTISEKLAKRLDELTPDDLLNFQRQADDSGAALPTADTAVANAAI